MSPPSDIIRVSMYSILENYCDLSKKTLRS